MTKFIMFEFNNKIYEVFPSPIQLIIGRVGDKLWHGRWESTFHKFLFLSVTVWENRYLKVKK